MVEISPSGGGVAVSTGTVLRTARARDEAVRLADAGDFASARAVTLEAKRSLQGLGLEEEAAALDVNLLRTQTYDAQARKQLRYECQQRRRRR